MRKKIEQKVGNESSKGSDSSGAHYFLQVGVKTSKQ